jgi:hypothetical protein
MGIRFWCPNGHKLNVKEFQAGLKGVCPTCGAKMQIPLKSTRPSSREEKVLLQVVGASAPIDVDSPAPVPAQPAAASPAPADDANVVWYVRPAGGGQYGPATIDVMQGWIDEGRIAADTLVWREGWREWQAAGTAFPQLSSDPLPAPAEQPIPGLENILDEPAPKPSQTLHNHRSTATRNQQTVILGAVVLTIIVLVAFLLLFWLKL